MKYTKTITALFLTVTLLSCNSKGSQTDSKTVAEEHNDEKFDKDAEKTAQFVVDAIANSYAEVRLTEAAEQRAIDPDVKSAAIYLNNEHNGLITRLKEYAAKKTISYPTGETEKDKSRLEKLMGSKHFDKSWCEEAKEVNKETIDSFEAASTFFN